jgi:hypothetical protein
MDNENPLPLEGARVKVGPSKTTFDILWNKCENHAAGCNTMTIDFYRPDGLQSELLFRIVVNNRNWNLLSTEIYATDNDY